MFESVSSLSSHSNIKTDSPPISSNDKASSNQFIESITSIANLPHEITPKHVKILSARDFFLSPRLKNMLANISNHIDSDNVSQRNASVTKLRGCEQVFFDGQGSIPSRFILSNRKAINELSMETNDTQILITPERGGALVLDHMRNAISNPFHSIKIPKISAEKQDELDIIHAVNELRKYQFNKLGMAKQLDDNDIFQIKRSEQMDRVKNEIVSAINGGHKVIGLVDTMVGGVSLNNLLDCVHNVLIEYPEAKFKIFIHQHTLHLNNHSVRSGKFELPFKGKRIKLSDDFIVNVKPVSRYLARPDYKNKTVDERKALHAEFVRSLASLDSKGTYGELIIGNGGELNYIIGEDVNFQMSNDDTNKNNHFYVFDKNDKGDINVVKIQPSAGATSQGSMTMYS
ncbi:hypothetical protein [Pantoea agglomerans]|uniref:hypothetical protein n=1 Tax=Enterobacter agglomerans TaxID=549 RepID=UPI0013D85D46|nr:hypothetical protein [Pantoea agglomerans]NEG60093.1 hypothetical protein [Pantoea agglomerans]